MTGYVIPFNRPYRSANEESFLAEALASGHLQGDGPMTAAATQHLKALMGVDHALLTGSCTHALEMAAILLDLGPGDEVVVPSYTFSSTAAAVVMRGATPVFADVTPDTVNLDPDSLEACVTDRTRAVFVVHYGGVCADMKRIQAVADKHGLRIVEDNAHGLGARWQGQMLGTFGELATQSFHATKNVQCGEGGALVINNDSYAERAEVVREKGTDRSQFLRGQVDKYTWNDLGSSYLPSELQAAVLRSQLESFDEIQQKRHEIWDTYAQTLSSWAADNGVRLMDLPEGVEHPAHVFYIEMPTHDDQRGILQHMRERGVIGTFHYVPLDSSPAGLRFGWTPHPCNVSHDFAGRMVRLPLFAGMGSTETDRVIEAVSTYARQ